MSENMIPIAHDKVEAFLTALFEQAGLPADDAAFHANALVQTNLWGVDSHGVLRVPIYVKRMLSGAVNTTPNIRKVRGALAFETWDGDAGAGFIVARDTMNRAIELAREYGVGAVGVTNSNHFGAAGIYARMATEIGFVGIVMTNVVPNIVAPGGSKPITGNNPIAFAVPTFSDFPFVLDISLSSVAGGKLLLASKKGEKIPLGWATDSEGRPTDDPDVAFKGFLLPVGGHKGLGLSYFVDIISGLMTGGAFQYGMKGMYKYPDDPSLTGHFMLAIQPEAVMDVDEFKSRMATFKETVKASPTWDENTEMMLPGEIEYRTEQRRRAEGLPLPQNLIDELNELASQLNVDQRIEA
jgi:L-2-hydroxycarboxylate dehydrogenase (NAD+)